MKIALAVTALLCISLAPAAHGDLIEDMKRLFALVPVEDVMALHQNFYQTDPEFALTNDFIHGPRCTELVLIIDELPEFSAYFDFVESKGIPGYYWLNKVRGYFGWPEFPAPGKFQNMIHTLPNTNDVSSRAYIDFINAVLGIMPVDEVIATWDDLMATSPEWRDMFALLQDPEYQAVRAALVDNPTYIEVDNEMISNGFDLTLILDTIWQFFKAAHP